MFDLNNIPFKQSPNYGPGPNSMRKIVIHTTEGSYDSSVNWLLSPAALASAHYVINEDGSACTQLVKDTDIAWHAGNWDYNTSCIGIEHSWFSDGRNGPVPDSLYRAGAALTAKLCVAHFITPNRGNIIGHGEIPPPNNHTDPGPRWDWNKFMAYVTQAYLGGLQVTDIHPIPNPPNFPPSPVPEFNPNPNNFNVGYGMLDFARSHQLVFVTNEQYFVPDANQPGLGKMSRAWVQDNAGLTYILVASEQPELAVGGIAPWKVEQYELIGA